METNQHLQSVVNRAYAADPKATERDLRQLANETSELQWLFMLGLAKEDKSINVTKVGLPPGVTKVGRQTPP